MDKLNFAKSLAIEAGLLIRESFIYAGNYSLKFDGSVITPVDIQINRIVVDSVKKNFPGYSVIGEEQSFKSSQNLGTWICDPIDGSLPYLLSIPTCVFSLALLDRKGSPVIVVVYDPFLERMYWAIRGGGAFEDARTLRVNSIAALDKSLIGNSGRFSKVVSGPKFKTHLYTRSYRPIILHSVIYGAMLVASGKIAATVLTGSGMHDAASAKLIVEEAGGKVTDLFGNDQRYDQPLKGAIFSNGLIHKEIVGIARLHKL